MNITQNELIEAVNRALTKLPSGDSPTMRELHEISPMIAKRTLREAVQKLVIAGEWECVRVLRRQMTGVVSSSWGYRPKVKV